MCACVCMCVQKDQLNLQSVDILSLRESLQVEQQRYRQLWDDRETVVTRLHSQIRQLQQGRDDYYTKNQELQVTHIHTHSHRGRRHLSVKVYITFRDMRFCKSSTVLITIQ